ncbi:MAG: polysaccharide biosynthesis/export family protein [Terracidiphilus sp.]|jgi:polysaccharide export outer membrane protein
MKLRFVFHCVLALTLATLAAAVHAQSSGPSVQIGNAPASTAGNAAAAAKAGMQTGLTAVPEDFSKLKIAPGFLLDVEVYDEPDLSGQLRVGDDGDVTLPFAGAVHVAGSVPAEAQRKIQESLRAAEILKNPQVRLNVVQYEPAMVTVLGEVNSPGRLQMLVPHSLLDVISFAGGETQLAGGEIQVRHEEAGQVTTTKYHYGRSGNGDTISGITVHNGDTVIVPRAGIVYVLGAVNRPGGYLMQEDGKLDVAQALSLAMGATLLAKTGEMHIIRRKADGTFVEFLASYKDITNGKATPPQLQAQDIVYVPNSRIKTLFSDTQNILSAAATATIYRTVQ